MKKLPLLFCSFLMTAIISCNDASNENKEEPVADTLQPVAKNEIPPMDSAATMKAWMDYMTPGDAHKMMASWNGKWKGEGKMWMSKDAPPTEMSGVAENKMILDGRYQESIHKGSFMGQPFEGKGLLAYDNFKKAFVNTWIDNMGTGIMSSEGKWDEASKSLTLTGKMTDPISGKDCEMREVIKVIDNKNQTMEMFTNDGSGEYKTMEMKMTRM